MTPVRRRVAPRSNSSRPKDSPAFKSPWRLWSSWVLAYTAGSAIGLGLSCVFLLSSITQFNGISSDVRGYIQFAVLSATIGVSLGIAQYCVLAPRFSGRWIAHTVMGWTIGGLSSAALATVVAAISEQHVADNVAIVILGATWGAVLGASQWLLLRGQFRQSGWWIATNAVCFAFGTALTVSAIGDLDRAYALGGPSGENTSLMFGGAVGTVGCVSVSAVITELVLVLLAQRPREAMKSK